MVLIGIEDWCYLHAMHRNITCKPRLFESHSFVRNAHGAIGKYLTGILCVGSVFSVQKKSQDFLNELHSPYVETAYHPKPTRMKLQPVYLAFYS